MSDDRFFERAGFILIVILGTVLLFAVEKKLIDEEYRAVRAEEKIYGE